MTLTLEDDDALPTVALALSDSSVSETGGVSTVTATLTGKSSEAVTVAAAAGSGAVAADFTQSGTTLTIAAEATASAGEVTVTANGNGVANPPNVTLTNDDALPTVALALSDTSVSETGGVSTVTAMLTNGHGVGTVSGGGIALTLTDDDTAGLAVSPPTSTGSRLETTESAGTATFTVKLATEPTGDVEIGVASSDTGEGTVDTDSMMNGNQGTLTFTTTNWSTAQTVTLTGVDDNLHDGNVTWQVRLTPSSGDGNYDALGPVDMDVTTTDAAPPEVTLMLEPSSISESGGVSTVTARLSHRSVADTTVTVMAEPVAPATAGDYTLSPSASTLIIAAGSISSTGVVTITSARHDPVDTPNKAVTVSVDRVDNSRATTNGTTLATTAATLTIRDIDEKGFVFNPAALVVAAEGSTSWTVKLTSEPEGTVTVASDAEEVMAPTASPSPRLTGTRRRR